MPAIIYTSVPFLCVCSVLARRVNKSCVIIMSVPYSCAFFGQYLNTLASFVLTEDSSFFPFYIACFALTLYNGQLCCRPDILLRSMLYSYKCCRPFVMSTTGALHSFSVISSIFSQCACLRKDFTFHSNFSKVTWGGAFFYRRMNCNWWGNLSLILVNIGNFL